MDDEVKVYLNQSNYYSKLFSLWVFLLLFLLVGQCLRIVFRRKRGRRGKLMMMMRRRKSSGSWRMRVEMLRLGVEWVELWMR